MFMFLKRAVPLNYITIGGLANIFVDKSANVNSPKKYISKLVNISKIGAVLTSFFQLALPD